MAESLTVKMETEKPSSLGFLRENAIMSAIRNTYQAFSERREALGLSNPGTVDNVAREVQKEVFLKNYMFTGLRAGLTKPFSISPVFHISHAFAMGSQEGLPLYTFDTLYGTSKVCDECELNILRAKLTENRFSWKEISTTKDSFPDEPTIDGQMHSSRKPPRK